MTLDDEINLWEKEHPETSLNTKSDSLADAQTITGFMRSGAKEGQRNNSFTRFACWLRGHGLSRDEIEDMLFVAEKAHDTGIGQRELSLIARSSAKYSVKLENRNPIKDDIINIQQAGERWRAQHAIGANFKTGFELLDRAMYALFPGEVLTIAGRSGAFKTTFGIEISKRIAESLCGKVFFASLEMNAESLFFRMGGMQISESDKTQYESAEIARRLNGIDFDKTISKYNGRFLIVDKDSLTIDQIETYLTLAKEDNNISVLLIDYLGYIKDAESGSAYDKVSRIAKGIKALAKRANIRIVLLCQTSRAGEEGSVPVQLHHLRDSGAIEESADNVLGLWHAQEEGRLHAELLKARHGRRNSKMDFLATGLSLSEDEFKKEAKKTKAYGG